MIEKIEMKDIGKDIDEILRSYLAVNSETGTSGEKDIELFLMNYFDQIPYFQENKDLFGSWAIKDDYLERAVSWAMVKGEGQETVVLIHHNDVVGVEDFQSLKHFAFHPDQLEEELKRIAEELYPEAREDLLSGNYLFGRGTADMKGGGAIQLSLLKRYAALSKRKGNILLLALPDEENLSAGMRAAVDLLAELKEKHGLQYVYVLNSEPHQRRRPEAGLLAKGSVGKLLAFVYVRGFLAHVGKVFEGLNPAMLLSEIATQVELSPFLSDHERGETSPPPTWLYLRDRKEDYNVSMPLGAGGCVSILTLNSNPLLMMEKLKFVAEEAFLTVIERMNMRYAAFCASCGRPIEKLPWKVKVSTYGELMEEAYAAHGEKFSYAYERKHREINDKVMNGEADLRESTFVLTEFIYNYVPDLSPRVVLGFVPPYYPHVCNSLLENIPPQYASLYDQLAAYSVETFGQEYDKKYYYPGISDLSYFALRDSKVVEEELEKDMPLYGEAYSVPLAKIEELSMPCMNIGPWGKDFHKMTERVYKQDLYERTPALLNRAIEFLLGYEQES